ncbi:hypothetical protein HBI56_073280 [Parastagonospora nodorum]|nr:hypothetical protein HBH53_145590 [Parastagonospora nodorum]KAH4003701.1 hypothetical protein HBI10_056670 [Parastagonospora nodorum]KAH4029190.1 hypothetical protein HBI13_045660 [Parastagonospora nodorum]KAH4038089.1 hypothetical protein HBI09_062910 [Parastagonospora nodorum]KAH4054395.1 hypothetical protein HBH49_079720 [Parastagonospora nodorum]
MDFYTLITLLILPFISTFTYLLVSTDMTILSLIPVKVWSPFKIDALGLITLLGAEAMRKSLGQLVYTPWEHFPLLAGYIFADNSVAEPVPGFILYNISEGIMATDLSSWFTRWLLCQQINSPTTVLKIRDAGKIAKETNTLHGAIAAFAVTLNVALIVLPALLCDWYGFAASLSLVGLIVVRFWTLTASREALDSNGKRAAGVTKLKQIKMFVTMPNGNVVTIRTTTGIVQDCLLTEARPQPKKAHSIVRAICWMLFGVHAISLGMACLVMQLVLVSATLLFSIAADQGWLNRHDQSKITRIGNRLLIERDVAGGQQNRSKAYALLKLTAGEEQAMIEWSLMPKRLNKIWWTVYECYKEAAEKDPAALETWGERMKAAHEVPVEDSVV